MRTPIFYAAIPILLGLCIPFSSFIFLNLTLGASVMLLCVVVFRSKINKIFDKRASIGLIFGLSICVFLFLKTYYKWSTCDVSKSVKELPAREISIDLILQKVSLQKFGNNVWKKNYLGRIINAPIIRRDLIGKIIRLTNVKLLKEMSLRKGDILRVKGIIKEDCSFLCCKKRPYNELRFHFYMSNVIVVKTIKKDMFSFWYNIRASIKRDLKINTTLTDDAKGFVLALTLGDKSLMPLSLMQLFSNTGTMHLFAVSGLHVGICCVFFKYLLMWLLPRPHLHISLSLLATFIYVILVGYSTSSCRAFIMICFLYGSTLFYRKKNGFSSLCWAALILLFWNPDFVSSLGFQLSFTVVLGILYVMEPQAGHIAYSKLRIVLSPAKVSLSAFLSSSLLIIDCFHHINLLSVFLNIIFVTIITPIFIFIIFFLILEIFITIHIIGECINYIILFMKLIARYFDSIAIAHVEFPATFDIPNLFHLLFPLFIIISRPFLKNLRSRLVFLCFCPLSLLILSTGS